jgi:hypothetical protein
MKAAAPRGELGLDWAPLAADSIESGILMSTWGRSAEGAEHFQ